MKQYTYKEQQHPKRETESRLLVTWPAYGYWHILGSIERHHEDCVEVWPAHGLHRDVSRLFDNKDEAINWLKQLWEARRALD